MPQIKIELKGPIILDTSVDWIREIITDQLAEDGIEGLESASEDQIHDAVRAIFEEDMGQLIDFDSLTSDDWEITVMAATTEPKSEG